MIKGVVQGGVVILDSPAALADGTRVAMVPANDYHRLRSIQDQWESMAAIKQGLADVAASRFRPAREVLAELAIKHWFAGRCRHDDHIGDALVDDLPGPRDS